jgi:spermidine synthase
MTSSKTRASVMFWCASILFFLSGGTGLAYQVVWFKKFNHVWGSSSLAMAAVVASFLTGLGLGAHLIGRVTDRVKGPLFWYGVAEILIGIIALIIPLEIQLLQYVAAAMYSSLLESQVLHTVVRYFFTFLVLAPPCILMGGTLPLLCKHFLRPGGAPRESTGWLYAINTLGATAGCYLAGFHIAPTIGLFWMNIGVAVLNLAIGGAAIALYKATSDVTVAEEAPAMAETEAGVVAAAAAEEP